MTPLILLGIPIGLAFGFALQRGRFCMNSAFRDVIVLKEYTLLKAVGLAILIQMVAFAALDMAGVITISPNTFFWGANMLGGFVFGIGMVVAGGCASGITYRFGEGMVGAMSAVLGLILVGLMTTMGAFHPLVIAIRGATTVTLANGANLTLANIFGIPHYILAFGIAGVALIIWAIRSKSSKGSTKEAEGISVGTKIFKKGWGWQATAIVIAIIGILAFISSTAAGRSYGLAICGGYWTTIQSLLMGQNLIGWLSVMLLCTILGSFIGAKIAGEAKLRAPAPKVLIQTFFGGCLMGFGAALGGGCNITHILTGVPQLALSSILNGAFIIFGCWTLAYFWFVRPMRNL